MKAVMISIRPEWCAKIASGKKTLEVRKTKPKLETPFKCYIYATKGGSRLVIKGDNVFELSKDIVGKVIGEFVCDRIDEYTNYSLDEQPGHIERRENLLRTACMTLKDWRDYIGVHESDLGYGWHISDLVIYDIPKELSEFYIWKKCNSCRKSGYEVTACGYDEDCKVPAIITRPPQSWCYVEELEGKE